jgi:Spy/CpxP family protein refolding chaperone
MRHSVMTAVRVLTSAACIGLAAPQLIAQGTAAGTPPADAAHPGMHRGPRPDLFKGITLSDAQKSQIDSIRAKYRSSMDAMRKGNGGGRDQMRQIMQSQWADMRNLLTADQQTIFDNNMKQMKERMQQHMQSGGPPPQQ